MNITNVTVRKLFSEGTLRAVMSVTFDEVFVIHDIKVLSIGERTLVVMPNLKNGDGTFRDVAHPIKAAFRREMEAAVLAAYRAALSNADPAEEKPTTV